MSTPPPLSESPYAFPGAVTLSATVTLDGQEITYQEPVDLYAWERLAAEDPAYRAHLEDRVRLGLAHAIADHLGVDVTVQVPGPRPAPDADAACQSVELPSEG